MFFLGGYSGSLEEIFNPGMIAVRELVEELLIADTSGRVYLFFNTEEVIRRKLARLLPEYKKFVFFFYKIIIYKDRR